jgi:hypothetical protein
LTYQLVIDTDFPKFIFDYSDALAVLCGKNEVQEGSLAAAEKTRDDSNRNFLRFLAFALSQ